MIKIKGLRIKRFRSILDLHLQLDTQNNLITFCGENNTGKTNTLRALDLFFNPQKYKASQDSPYHKFMGSRGGAVYPDISIDFQLENGDVWRINRRFNLDGLEKTEGTKLKVKGIRNSNKAASAKETDTLLKKINFFFIESVNISIPNLINGLIDDLFDYEYGEAQFRGAKSELKKSFDKYTAGLLDILSQLSAEINPIFKEFKEKWGVGFDLTTDIKKFRDLITHEIQFYINDSSNKRIESKGAGLQRLGYILLHFRIIEKIKSKSVFMVIDEPDAFLHQGLEKKLHELLLKLTSKCQIFMTTHSPIFIDSYRLNNVFLLELDITDKEYQRRGMVYSVLNTKLVKLDQVDGARKIRSYLGIDDMDFDLIDRFNILVEGETDKIYIEQLAKYFRLKVPKIICANGADNIEKHLDFYNSFYSNEEVKAEAPYILVLLDNDNKGREVFKKVYSDINGGKYSKLKLNVRFVPNFLGESPEPSKLDKVHTDHQIEDLIYPKLFCFLVNELLKKRGLKTMDVVKASEKIQKPAHKDRGILYLCENEKNEKNQDTGQIINFISSSRPSEQVKRGLAGLLQIEGNKKIVDLIESERVKYPKVEEFLEEITNVETLTTLN